MNWLFTAVFQFSPHKTYSVDKTRYEVVEYTISLQGSIASALAEFLNESRQLLGEDNRDGTFQLVSHSVTPDAAREYGPVFEEVLSRVPEPHRKNFESFVIRGEAPEEFMSTLDTNPQLARLAEEVFQIQARAMERLQKVLNR